VASRRWVYQQYDHEVGVRTAVKPGQADAAVLKLPNGRFLAVKGDGNSKHCYLDPYSGAAGCVAEACRNVVAVGAEPIAMVDHLQFGDPSDPEIYWSFEQSIAGMADYCKALGLPVVGGKVSFYNEDAANGTAIKPTPLALVIGLIDAAQKIVTMRVGEEDKDIVLVGETRRELGGSEYYDWVLGKAGGLPPAVHPQSDRILLAAVRRLIGSGDAGAVHDCSSGGLATAICEMCVTSGIGARIDLDSIPADCDRSDELLFSESHGRFILACEPDISASTVKKLTSSGIPSAVIGSFLGRKLTIERGRRPVTSVPLRTLAKSWEDSFSRLMGE
jgi:phosphoribosylformylglycinamidine synthase